MPAPVQKNTHSGFYRAVRNPLAIGMRPNDMNGVILALHTRHRERDGRSTSVTITITFAELHADDCYLSIPIFRAASTKGRA